MTITIIMSMKTYGNVNKNVGIVDNIKYGSCKNCCDDDYIDRHDNDSHNVDGDGVVVTVNNIEGCGGDVIVNDDCHDDDGNDDCINIMII